MEFTIPESSDPLAIYTKGDFTLCTYTSHKTTIWHAPGRSVPTAVGHGIGYPDHYMFSYTLMCMQLSIWQHDASIAWLLYIHLNHLWVALVNPTYVKALPYEKHFSIKLELI